MASAKGLAPGVYEQLTPEQQERGMRNLTYASAIGTTFFYTVYGSAWTLFAKKMQAPESLVGLISAIIQMTVILQIPFAREVETRGKKRLLMPTFALLGVFSLPLAALPFLPAPMIVWQRAMVACFACLAVVQQLMSTAWSPLHGDVIPAEIRGRFLGRIQTAWQSSALVTTICLTFFLGTKAAWWQYQVVFLVGALSCFGRLPFVWRVPELAPNPVAGQQGRFSFVRDALRDVSFRRFMLFVAFMNFALNFMGPFSITYMRDTLKYGDGFITMATQGLPLVGAILTLILWGHLADRIGNRAIFIVTTVGMALTTLVWLFVKPADLTSRMALVGSILVRGLLAAGWGLAVNRFFFGALPRTNKAGYTAAYTVLVGVLAGVGPSLAGPILDHSGLVLMHVGGLTLDNYKIMFVVSGLASILPLWFILGLRNPDDAPTGELLNFLRSRPVRTTMDLVLLSRPLDEDRRAEVTRRLAGAPSAVMVRELLAGLDDPSYEVREAAAHGLALHRRPAVVAALLAKAREPDAMIRPSIFWTLGELETPEAADVLIEGLAAPDEHARAQAALALGKIGRREAPAHHPAHGRLGPALRERLTQESDPFVWACVATALSRLGSAEVVPQAAERLGPTTPPAVRRQLATALGGLLPLRDDFYSILRGEMHERGSAARPMVERAMEAAPGASSPAAATLGRLWQAYLRMQDGAVVRLATAAATVDSAAPSGPAAALLAHLARVPRTVNRPVTPEESLLALTAFCVLTRS